MAELFHCGYPKRRCQIKSYGTILLKDFLHDFISMVIKYDRLKMNADDICAKDIENSSTLNRPVTLTLGELSDLAKRSLRSWTLCTTYNNLSFGGLMEDTLL